MIFYIWQYVKKRHTYSCFRYAKEVVNILRLIVLYAIIVNTGVLTLCGIILLLVSEIYDIYDIILK